MLIVLPAYNTGKLSRWTTIKGQHFSFFYQSKPAMSGWAAQHSFAGPLPHVLRPKILHLYENRDPNTLWWHVSANRLPYKKVVRGACADRARKGFRDALYLKGYDADGQPLSQERLPEGVTLQPRPLAGTLEIVVHESAVTQYDSQVIRKLMSDQLHQVLGLMQQRPMYESRGNRT